MPYLVVVIGYAIKMLAGYLVVRLLTAAGVGYVIYEGIGTLFDNIESQVKGTYLGMSGDILAIATMAGADVAISVLLSAVSIRFLLSGMVAGAFATWRIKAELAN